MNLLLFLAQVLLISCSGAMQPGPVTATVITMGARNRYAGTLLALGHGVIEFPLMVVIILGLGRYFELPKVQIAVGLAGGAFLMLMGVQSLVSLRTKSDAEPKVFRGRPILAGIILSAGNPYFLLWWATVGLALATQATQWGIWVFGLFALTHWLVDLIWLQALSWASFKGSVLLGRHGQRIVQAICSVAMFGFGVFFVVKALAVCVRLS
ncbi:MAG: LysE family transporter [Phycisphaerales bacterium]|nr:MAG: LysE family transporter [Phycisphaerales bacterium]